MQCYKPCGVATLTFTVLHLSTYFFSFYARTRTRTPHFIRYSYGLATFAIIQAQVLLYARCRAVSSCRSSSLLLGPVVSAISALFPLSIVTLYINNNFFSVFVLCRYFPLWFNVVGRRDAASTNAQCTSVLRVEEMQSLQHIVVMAGNFETCTLQDIATFTLEFIYFIY